MDLVKEEKNFRGLLLGIWLGLSLLSLYFYFNAQEPLRRIAANLFPLVLSLTFVISICGHGSWLSRLLARKQDSTTQILTAFALGMGLTGAVIFVSGFFGYFFAELFGIWFLAGVLLFLPAALRWFRSRPVLPELDFWNTTALAILTLFTVPLIPFIVAPEVSHDSLMYHLLIPKLYLRIGGVVHLPLFVEAYYPSLAEYNYLPMLALTDEIVCKCFHFWVTMLLLASIYKITKRIAPESSALPAPSLFLSMPVVAIHMGWSWNDFMFTFFISLALLYLLSYQEDPQRRKVDLFLAAVIGGLASWTKYTFILIFCGFALVVVTGVFRWKWERKHLIYLPAGIVCFASFWIFQNWYFTGNPVYPFLNKIFQSPYWTEAADRFLHNALRRWEIQEWTWKNYFTFPFYLTIKPRLVDIQTGIMPLVLIPALFLGSSSPGIRLLKVFIVGTVIGWILIQTENRSLLSVMMAIFIVTSVSLQEKFRNNRVAKGAILAVLILAVSTNFFFTSLTTYYLFDPVPYFLGRESKEEYISQHAESQKVYDYLNRSKDVRKVLLVGLHSPFYLERPFLFSSWSDPPIAEVLTLRAGSCGAVEANFRQLGVTHMVLNQDKYLEQNRASLYSWSEDQRKMFENCVQSLFQPVARFGSDVVLKRQE